MWPCDPKEQVDISVSTQLALPPVWYQVLSIYWKMKVFSGVSMGRADVSRLKKLICTMLGTEHRTCRQVIVDRVFLSKAMSWVQFWENNNKKRQNVGMAFVKSFSPGLTPQVFLPNREPCCSSLSEYECWLTVSIAFFSWVDVYGDIVILVLLLSTIRVFTFPWHIHNSNINSIHKQHT